MTKKIETPEEKKNRETTESIAKNLMSLVESIQALLKGPLKRKTLLVLLAHSSGMNQRDVDKVLQSVESLAKDWLN